MSPIRNVILGVRIAASLHTQPCWGSASCSRRKTSTLARLGRVVGKHLEEMLPWNGFFFGKETEMWN